MRARLLALALLPLSAHAHAQDLAKLRREIKAARKASPVPGLSVAVVKDGRVVFAEGFGLADVATRRRATAETVYDIGSVTKSFTALLAAQAEREGRLSLKDRPAKYLPAFRLRDKDANDRITLEDMLSHRSGLARTDLAMVAGDFTRDELMRLAAGSEATAPLGKAWQYQNLMFAFMGTVLEKATGESYDALLAERFFRPLGMDHSASAYAASRAEPRLATGYSAGGAALALRNIDNVAPAGSISSSVLDMAKAVRMLLAGGEFEGRRLFDREAIENTRKSRIEMVPGTGQTYGLGWMLSTEDGVQRVFHGGNIDGFTANVALVPAKGLGVVVLSNGDSSPLPTEVTALVLAALDPKKAGAEGTPAFAEATPAELRAYHSATPPIDVAFVREGKRTFLLQNGGKVPLDLVGPKRYSLMKAAFLTFGDKGPDGKPMLRVEQAGKTFVLTVAEPYRSPVSAEEVLAMEVRARGGAEAIRRHPRSVIHFHGGMPNEALTVYGLRYRRDEAAQADFVVLYGLDRRFANILDGTDGKTAFTRLSFMASLVKRGPAAADAVLAASLLADLEPARFYRSMTVVREDKVDDKPVWVLEKVSPTGTKTTDFVSKADGRLLSRIAGAGASLRRDVYSDFRTVDGLTLPFHTVSTSATGGRTVEEIDAVRFDERVPEWPFRG